MPRIWPLFLPLALAAVDTVHAQAIHCIDPPTTTPSEAACRVEIDASTRALRLVVQLRGGDEAPVPGRIVTFRATSGQISNAVITDVDGYADVIWRGGLQPEPVVITATTSGAGTTTNREIRLVRRVPAAPAYIIRMSPDGDHSAFAGRFLGDDIEAEIAASPAACSRTIVIFEYLSVGTGSDPAPKRYESPGLWSPLDIDNERFGCAARLRWPLSNSAGKQALRAWIKRDSSFAVSADSGEARRYQRDFEVRAIAHALPSFLAGAAVVEAGDVRDSSSVATLVGIDFSFPTMADFLKHNGLSRPGELVDRTRLFLGTDFGADAGKNVYLGAEPLVFLLGPRAADVPIAFVAGRRVGEGRNRWFAAGFINASTLASTVLSGIGIK